MNPEVTAGAVPAVAMRSITKRFPGVLANDSVDFEAREGEVHALLGENGAGKSTLASILTGLYRPDAGDIEIYGRRVEFHSPRDAMAAGVSMVHQHFRLAASLTVADNIVLGHQAAPWLRASPRTIESQVTDLARRYRMPVNPTARIWQLSVGEQQRVEILKSLYRGARILILDEPTSLLTPQEADDLFETLRRMTAEGRTIVFVSHKLEELMAGSDRVTVLRGGRVVGTGETKSTTPPQLSRRMGGRAGGFAQPKEAHRMEGGEGVLELRGISADGDLGIKAVNDVSLAIKAGEIVGIAGVSGNGQRELAEAISGARRRSAGDVIVDGRRPANGGPEDAVPPGIAHPPEEPVGPGRAPHLSGADNPIFKTHRPPPLAPPGI